MPDCQFCGEPFTKKKGYGNGRQIYCGIDCAQEVIHVKSGHYWRLGDAQKRAEIWEQAKARKRARIASTRKRAV